MTLVQSHGIDYEGNIWYLTVLWRRPLNTRMKVSVVCIVQYNILSDTIEELQAWVNILNPLWHFICSVKRQETIRNNNVIPPPPPPPLASPPPLRQTRHKTNASVQRRSASRKKTITSSSLPTSSANLATLESSTTAADCHREIINSFLSSIGVKSRLDRFGIAYLPMNKLQLQSSSSSPSSARNSIEKMNLLMVIEAPPTQHTFKLYTHFNATARHMKRLTNSLLNENNEGPLFSSSNNNGTNDANENKVLHNLLQHGKHKALTLTRICDERVKFVLESKTCEITSTSKLKGILNMFVKVSYRMKKRIEA